MCSVCVAVHGHSLLESISYKFGLTHLEVSLHYTCTQLYSLCIPIEKQCFFFFFFVSLFDFYLVTFQAHFVKGIISWRMREQKGSELRWLVCEFFSILQVLGPKDSDAWLEDNLKIWNCLCITQTHTRVHLIHFKIHECNLLWSRNFFVYRSFFFLATITCNFMSGEGERERADWIRQKWKPVLCVSIENLNTFHKNKTDDKIGIEKQKTGKEKCADHKLSCISW